MATWNFVLNPVFLERYGPDAGGKVAEVLVAAGEKFGPGDREDVVSFLERQFADVGFEMPAKSIDQLAENLTLAEHDHLVISSDDGKVLAEEPLKAALPMQELDTDPRVPGSESKG